MNNAEKALQALHAELRDRAGEDTEHDWGVLWSVDGLDEAATTFMRECIDENAAVFLDGSVLFDQSYSDDGEYGNWVVWDSIPPHHSLITAPGYRMIYEQGYWRFYGVVTSGEWSALTLRAGAFVWGTGDPLTTINTAAQSACR